MISIVAGTRIKRTRVASSAIATDSPSPISLIEGVPVEAKTPNTATMIKAALEIVAALPRRPWATAVVVFPVASYRSRMRDSKKTHRAGDEVLEVLVGGRGSADVQLRHHRERPRVRAQTVDQPVCL
jgi:hypothetical protein